jgi:segregation and condensation protein B
MDSSKENPDSQSKESVELSIVGQPWDEKEEDEDEEHGLSLEELSQTYASVLNKSVTASSGNSTAEMAVAKDSVTDTFDELDTSIGDLTSAEGGHVTPQSILEAILFVGRPDNTPITPEEAASVMRGVKASEIELHVAQLNQRYVSNGSAMRIVAYGAGYRMQLADDLQHVRDRFYGPARQAKLNQAAIDCLALVAYQPGITREQLEDQRHQPCGAILNQMVRRQLIEIKRQGKKNREIHYFPTSKLVHLIGLESIEDLPQVEDDS